MTPANPDDLIGRLIDGRYQVRSLIARGGMATVYLATDLRLERRVAVKIMHDHLAADQSFRDRFIREARAAARLQHPNVVNVYDQGEDGALAYIVMEYVPGITLRDLLNDHHRLTAEQTIDVLDAVLNGLQAAHRLGIVHRDLKPENVLLADDGRIKLSDFGLARAASAHTASTQVLLGTIAYLSPELVTKGTADIRSDVYSLGIMMYEMLTGQQPYRGDQPVNIAYRHANEDVPAPSERQPGVPASLDELVRWATARDPDRRPADAGELLAALRRTEAGVELDRGAERLAAPLTTAAGQAAAPGGSLAGIAVAERSASDAEGRAEDADRAASSRRGKAGKAVASDTAAGGAGAHEQTERSTDRPRRRRRTALVLTLVVLLVLLGGAGGTAAWYQLAGPGSYLAVPTLSGLQQAEAEQLIVERGFTVGSVGGQSSLQVPEGQVISSTPGEGVTLPPESAIDLVVSSGPAILTVPTGLVGLTQTQAEYAITQAGFTVDATSHQRQFNDAAAGAVLIVTDAQGAELPAELPEQSAIRLVISAGPVPDVEGDGETEALATLREAELDPTPSYIFHDTVPQGVVAWVNLTTDPVRPGDGVEVVISKGPDVVTVPSVTGLTVEAASAALSAAGLVIQDNIATNTNLPVDLLRQTMTVVSQNPSAGQVVKRGSTVAVTATL